MRNILFRGKDLTGAWHYGVPLVFSEELVFITAPYENNRAVITETVGQYTGLTVNGTKIFEGDICRNTKTGEIVFVAWHGTMAGYVWSRRKEGCEHLFDFGELFRCYDKYEIIGNIHDNPELLEGGAE